MNIFLNQRKQRLSLIFRDLVSKVYLDYRQFIQPIFVKEGINNSLPIPLLPEIYNESIDSIILRVENDIKKGVRSFLLFVNQIEKNDNPTNYDFHQKVIHKLKAYFKDSIFLIADVCLCGITKHGHCGILLKNNKELDNILSVNTLAQMSLALVEAGADSVAPSDMNDGTVLAIHNLFCKNNFDKVPIIAYSTKMYSALYGPFREACSSSPSKNEFFFNRSTYQIDPRNTLDAIACSQRDQKEGASILMVKPAGGYLDIIQSLKKETSLPLAAYQVSGEYAALELLALHKMATCKDLHLEAWTAIKRAGGDIIISYAARHAKNWINT